MRYEIVIGLEVHVQLLTRSKLFCGCENGFTHEQNTHICPVCLGLPGSLPVLNREAFRLSVRAALALGCEIPEFTKFDRKHYYYPDLPKNYQISQYDLPLSQNGFLDIEVDGRTRRIGITRAHLEEDAGKLIHGQGGSAVDLNRTGTPLLEIVSEPDLRSPAEARAYLELLKLTLQYVGVSDCNMEEGSLRCDANISVRPEGREELGVKNEIKNMNSFRGAERALTLVGESLVRACETGDEIRQVTWGYSVDKDRVFRMRTKEEANDYRYFPDPDLPPVHVKREWVEELRRELPELPRARQQRLQSEHGLSGYDAGVLVQDPAVADYFEEVAGLSGAPKESANWVINDVARQMNEQKVAGIGDFPVSARALAELVCMCGDSRINRSTARKVFDMVVRGDPDSPARIVERDGLAQVSDTGAIAAAVQKVIAENPDQAGQVRGGKHTAAMWFVGQVMRMMQGKADPQAVTAAVAGEFGFDPALLQKQKKKKKKKS